MGGVAGLRCRLGAVALVAATIFPTLTSGQSPGDGSTLDSPPRPPALIPQPPAPASNLAPSGAGSPPPPAPGPPITRSLEPTPPPGTASPAVPNAPMVPPGQVALTVSARFGREPPAINGGLHWRVYPDKPDAAGVFRPLREDKTASPTFVLPAGGYVVHVTFGLANAAKRVQLRSETVREVFEIAAGGVRFEGRVGDSRIPPGQISFDLFPGSQFEAGEKRKIAEGVTTGDIVLLPEGMYHVVSTYGQCNSVVRSDIRVRAGKLTDAAINHRAAVITLKLVSERGGEALANTAWTVLTPGGDIIKELIGAFPKMVLAEGDYRVIARNEGKPYPGEFKVEAGVDREVEVQAR